MLKGSADYLKRKREPEVHPVNHLYPLELSLTHEYRTALPIQTTEILPEDIDPELDFSNYDEPNDELIEEPERTDTDTDGTDLNLVPPVTSSSVAHNLAADQLVKFSRRGRLIKPPSRHADFIPFD